MEADDRLADLGLFAGLPAPERKDLARRGLLRSFAPGERIAERGRPVNALYAVVEGRVKLSRGAPDGREQTLSIFGPGDPFCLCGVFGEGVFLSDAVAMSACRVFILSRQEFDRAAERHPVLLANLVSLLSQRLREVLELTESLALREIPQRVGTFLLHAPIKDDAVHLGMTHRELAKLVGATPETLSRVLRRLAEQGLLSIASGRIRILDAEGLRALVEGNPA
ncbi:MAG: Crp/Fnr family transcriptional regulator [Desulfovibrio sp.]